ncbi:MAG: ATP synthase F1 subunit epsilon [Erysipelotrichaceae bacterium]|jgi:F-type H+-transporting ATPase subunit epsilon|nr:ATP synthase F1 subunit epsilon [Erysipelotrichaceae bacterium]
MITVNLITPEGLYRTVETSRITIDTIDGQRGILSNHMPIVLMLKIGTLKTIENGNTKRYTINGGMMYFENNVANILSDAIEDIELIDVERAQKAADRANERLAKKADNLDIQRAQLALARAMNRIQAVHKYQ